MIGPDEPRYTEIAREMYVTGDWITPRLAGMHWFEKPALTYWLVAAGFQAFGVSEFAARLPESFKVRGSTLKVLLKDLLKDKLPSIILDRAPPHGVHNALP